MFGHPSKPELLAYAEALVDGRGISTTTARHVNQCRLCAMEVAAIRSSIEFAASADALSPTDELTSQILVAARTERQVAKRARGRAPLIMLKGLAYVASVAVFAGAYFSIALEQPQDSAVGIPVASPQRVASASPSAEEIRRATAEIQTLAAAVGARPDAPRSLREWQQARTVVALDADLTAAKAALERNPGSERARSVMSSNIARQAKALKSLYLERSL